MAAFTLRNALPKANLLHRGILSSQRRTLITLSDHLVSIGRVRMTQEATTDCFNQYTAHATASGAGRNGHAKSNDGTASKFPGVNSMTWSMVNGVCVTSPILPARG